MTSYCCGYYYYETKNYVKLDNIPPTELDILSGVPQVCMDRCFYNESYHNKKYDDGDADLNNQCRDFRKQK